MAFRAQTIVTVAATAIVAVFLSFSIQYSYAAPVCALGACIDAKPSGSGGRPSGGGTSSSVPSGPSPEEVKQQKERARLKAKAWSSDEAMDYFDRKDWDNAIRSFEEALERDPDDPDLNNWLKRAKAEKAKAQMPVLALPARPAPHTDTSVVDARVPRDGPYLTAQVPELARSPAADRITKGFQAVINHDWPVALAWWQDALQRDPNNAALKRSVDLAQWMVDRRKAVAAGPATPLSAAIHAAARGDNAEAIRQFELAKVENPASATHVDSMIATIKQKSAQQAKQAAISAEITNQQISLLGKLNDEGLKMLAVGKDKEAQKLFDEAQFLSMGLSPKQVKSYDSPYFGSMNAVSAKQLPSQAPPTKAKPKP